jgi:CP family cyanate transporter-like MFS transporter
LIRVVDSLVPSRRFAGQVVLLVAITLLGFNLRLAVVSVGPLLGQIAAATGMSAVAQGVLTTLPVVTFGVFGILAPGIARRLGLHQSTIGALLLVTAGSALRSQAHSTPLFLLTSAVALSGLGMANVLLPALVKRHFPRYVGAVTSVYATALAIGLTTGASATIPLGSALGSWRAALAVWAVTAGVALIPWLVLARGVGPEAQDDEPIRLSDIARTRLGWMIAVTFGVQSAIAYSIFGWLERVYVDAGFSAAGAGALVGITTAVGIPISFVIPSLVSRITRSLVLILPVVGGYPIGFVGLMIAPHAGALFWALAIGVGQGSFPLILTLLSMRARTPAGIAPLSGFVQSVGYALAIPGPFLVGVLYSMTGGWTAALVLLTGAAVLLAVLCFFAAQPAHIEDSLTLERQSHMSNKE